MVHDDEATEAVEIGAGADGADDGRGLGAVGAGRDFLASLADRLREGDRSPWGIGTAVVGGVVVLWSIFAADIKIARWLIAGLESGAVYSLIALGIALVYKSTRVLNYAQGELGTVPAFLAYALMVSFRWSDQDVINHPPDASRLWWATIVAVVVGAGLAVVINTFLVQRLAQASPVTSLVATAGAALLFISAEVVIFEAKAREFPRYVSGDAFSIAGEPVRWNTVLILLVLAGAVVVLATFFRTRAGVALLATAQEPFAAELSGVSVRAMSTLAWAGGGALAAIGGLLATMVFGNLRPGLVTSQYLTFALVAAVLGGLTSMVGAVVGGLLLGLVTVYANLLITGLGWDVPGPPQIAMLTVALVVLLVRPRGLFGKEA